MFPMLIMFTNKTKIVKKIIEKSGTFPFVKNEMVFLSVNKIWIF